MGTSTSASVDGPTVKRSRWCQSQSHQSPGQGAAMLDEGAALDDGGIALDDGGIALEDGDIPLEDGDIALDEDSSALEEATTTLELASAFDELGSSTDDDGAGPLELLSGRALDEDMTLDGPELPVTVDDESAIPLLEDAAPPSTTPAWQPLHGVAQKPSMHRRLPAHSSSPAHA